jgi:hypothetical protein
MPGQPGNLNALKHGGRSLQCRQEARQKVRLEMHALILAALPDQEPPAGDLFLVDLLETAFADVRQMRDFIDAKGGPVSADGRPYKAMEMLNTRERRALELMDRLGFGPRSRAQIMASLGAAAGNGLASQLAAHRRALRTIPAETREVATA